jgi:hypothetical protein
VKSNAHLEIRVSVRVWKKQKGKVFGTLSQLKTLNKSNEVHAQNNFLAVRNELLLPLKIRVTVGGDITFFH